MTKDLSGLPQTEKTVKLDGLSLPPSMSPPIADWLFAQAQAAGWGLSREQFAGALQRSVEKRLSGGSLAADKIEEYLRGLHLEDLALATACLENCEAAWEHFVSHYRGYLRAAAAAVLRCRSGSLEACDLADSLFAELFGLAAGARRERSLFRYFHGRSSLKTWLRAVLAQRHVDAIRAGRRFDSLDDEDCAARESKLSAAFAATVADPRAADPHRERYAALFVRALQAALASLEPRDEQRVRLYYAKQQTLAEIGRQLGEHESSVSRNLDRIRAALRRTIEETLRNGCPAANGFAAELGLSEAQIALAFEYAAADTPFDLDKVLASERPATPAAGKLKP
jgi:RNA polymerase sigma factor (sigma-70 family)